MDTTLIDFDRMAVGIPARMEDAHIEAPGAVGVWTKADSVTSFDDFAFGAAR